jgi:hypothetical protein
MINNRVLQHIIQWYLGHESPHMTAVYASIHDQTMKAEIAKYQGKVVNIAGQVVSHNDVEADEEGLQWFKRNYQRPFAEWLLRPTNHLSGLSSRQCLSELHPLSDDR